MKKLKFLTLLLFSLSVSTSVFGATYTVTTLADNQNAGDPLTGSLRWAIAQADMDAAYPHVIEFDPALNGTIDLGGLEMWEISEQVTLDGDNRIVINCNGAPFGLRVGNLNASGTIIKNLTIYGASNSEINCWAGKNIQIDNCVLGLTSATGTASTTAAQGLVMTSEDTEGFVISNCTIAGHSNQQINCYNTKMGTISGCFLGVNRNSADCTTAPYSDGIQLESSQNMVVRDNLISGNGMMGIRVNASNNVTIEGNYIGVNLGLTSAVPNGDFGIYIHSGSNNVTIGPAAADLDKTNVIGGNANGGIVVDNANQIVIQNSYVGVSPTDVALGNGGYGIQIQNTEYFRLLSSHVCENMVQGVCLEAGNSKVEVSSCEVKNNGCKGIQVQQCDYTDAGNYCNITNNTIIHNGWSTTTACGSGIMLCYVHDYDYKKGVKGVNISGNTITENCEGGIYVNSKNLAGCEVTANTIHDNLIYGNNIANIWFENYASGNTVTGNTIYGATNLPLPSISVFYGTINNAGAGILVAKGSATDVLNQIGATNRIYCNAGKPIDLNINNHAYNGGSGNAEIPAPSILPGSSTTTSIKGTGRAGATVFVYDNTGAGCDCAGGYTCIGTATVDASGNWTCVPTVTPASLVNIAAMQVGTAGNSSEFTDCCLVQGGTLAKKDANAVCSGTSFVMTMTDVFGASFELQRATSDNGTYTTVTTVTSGTEITAPAVTVATNTTYWYQLKVTNGTGCEATSNKVSVMVYALPTASISGGDAVCQNGTLTLTGSGGTTYSWKGGAYAATNTFSVNTATAGTPSITLKVKDGNGCESAQVSKGVTVNALPTASISGDAAVCQNGTLTLTGSGADNYSWNGGAYSTTATYSVNTASASTPTITLKVKDGNGCESAQVSKSVTVNALPTASIDGDAAVCKDGTLQLTGSGASNYSWNGGAYSTTNTYDVATGTTGPQTITLKVKDGNGCESAQVSKAITVNALPVAQIDGDDAVCQNGTLTLTGSGADNYSWNGGAYSTTATYAVPTSSASTPTITLKVKDANGCESAQVSKTVTVNALPSASIVGDAQVCQNGTLTLSGGTGSTYSWNYGAFTSTSTFDVNTATAGPQNIKLIVKSAAGCESAVVSKDITVNALPVAQIDGDAAACQNGTLTLTGSGAANYSWNDGAYSTTATYSVNTASASTPTITLKVKDGNGCESEQVSKNITVNALPTASISGDAAVCKDGALQLSGSGATNYSWNGGAYSTTNTYDVATGTAGPQTITLKVKDGNGCESAEESKNITVNALPTLSVTSQPAAVCAPGTVDLTTATLNQATGLSYYQNDGTTPVANPNAVSAGTYKVTYTDGNGCVSDPASLTAMVKALPTIQLKGGTSPACTITKLQYTAEIVVSAGTVTTDLGTVADQGSNNWLLTADKDVNVMLTVNADGCEATLPVEAPNCDCPVIASPTGVGVSYCAGSAIPSLTANATLAAREQIEWYNVATDGSALATGATYNPTAAGDYYAQVTNIDDGCHSARTQFVVTMNALPTATLSDGDKLCTGADLVLTANSATATEYNWNGAGFVTTSTYTVPNTDAGTQHITLKVKDANSCESATEVTRDVVVTLQPAFSNIQTAECSDDKTKYTMNIDINVPIPSAQYTLTTDNGTSVVSGSTATITGDKDVNVLLTLQSNDNPACVATYTVTAPDCSCGVIDVPGISNASYCAGSPVAALTATATLAVNERVEWFDVADGGAVLADGLSYTPTTAGDYYAQVTNTLDHCHSARVKATLTENPLPVLTVTSQPVAVCAPNTVNLLTAVLSQSTNLTYYESDATTPVTNNTAVAGGDYKVTYTDDKNCVSAPATLTATVNPQPTQFNVTGGGGYCDGEAGVAIGLSGSQKNVTYTLKFNGFDITPSFAGTGSALDFGEQSSDGAYTVFAENDLTGCTADMNGSQSVTINPIPSVTIDATGTAITCSEPEVTLTANATNVSFAWGNGATGAALKVTEAGDYEVTVTDLTTACQNTASQSITYEGGEEMVGDLQLTPAATVAIGAEMTLSLNITAGESTLNTIEWYIEDEMVSEGTEKNYTTSPYLTHVYKVKAIGACNTLEFEQKVDVVWPTVITPYNQTGKNDTFLTSIKEELNMIIYDRFGDKIYEGTHGWDGTKNGKMVSPGVYFYHVVLPNGEAVRGTIEVYRD